MQAKGIKISKLKEATEIREHDVIPIVQDGETKKLKASKLKADSVDCYTKEETDELIANHRHDMSDIDDMDIGSCNFILQSAFVDKSIEYDCDGDVIIDGGVATIRNATHFDMEIGSAFGAIKRSDKLSLIAIANTNNNANIPMNKYIGGNINIFSENYEYINKSVADLNVNLITVPVVVSIDSANSNDPIVEEWALNRTKAYLSNLKKDGLITRDTKLIFEPHPLINYGGVSETDYNPTDKDIFFEKWKNLIIDSLTALNEYDFYGFYIGTNFQQFDTGEDNINRWSKLCSDLKAIFRNQKIIYRTNWWVTATWDEGVTQIYKDKLNNPIWGIVDVISISSYFELNDKANPTVDELYDNIMNGTSIYNRGQRVFDEVKSFYDKWSKPIMFGELGCPSKDYGAMHPWSNLTGNPDNETVQYNVIEAYNRAFVYKNDEYDNSWFLGYSIFALGSEVSEFDVIGKQGQQSIINAVNFIDSNSETTVRCRVINKDNNHVIADYKLPLSNDMTTSNIVRKKLDVDGHKNTKISFDLNRGVTFRLSKPMLVQGDKMVNWSPSVQDSEIYTDGKVTVMTDKLAQLTVKADNINAKVQENTIKITQSEDSTNTKITEITEKVGQLDIKADNINASVRENTTKITETKAEAETKITEITQKVGELDIKADNINASVRENTTKITETKAESDIKITEITEKVGQLNIKADNINASVRENHALIIENKADADNRIIEVSEKMAELDIKADNINAMVQENSTKITENKADADSKITEVNERVGQLDIKADNINASVQANTTIITENKADSDSKITEVNKKIGELDIKADGIIASVRDNTTLITENITDVDSKITEVSERIGQIDIKANNINAIVQENTTKITENKADIDGKITEVDKKVAQLDIKATSINASVEANTATIIENKADADSKIVAANKKIGQIDIKADTINASVQENTTLITANKADTDSQIVEANKKISQLDIKANSINASVQDNTTKITANKADADSKITEANKKIAQIDIKADNINASVASNTSKITANKSDADKKIVEINKNISAIDLKADNINATVKKNTTAITANKADADSKITDVNEKFTQLDLKADNINATVASNTSKITANKTYLDTKVTEINKSISNVDVKANGISSKVSALETKTNTIDGKVTNQEGRLATAEQKITPSAITTTVTSSKTYQDNLAGKVSTNKVVSSINQTSETIKIQANKIQLEGAVTAGSSGRQVRINNGDYSAIIDGSEKMFFGSRDFENTYKVPKFYMGAYGFDTATHNYFGMTSYRGNGDNPESNTYAYQDLSYRCINSAFKDWSNIKMYSNGRIRIAPVENLEITTNFNDGSYAGTDERRLALFATSTSQYFNSNLQIGCLRNMTNTNGLILGDDYHSGKEARVRVHTDSSGNKFFRPLTGSGDISNGSASFPWKSVSSKSVYSQEGIVNTGVRATEEITTDNVLDNLEFIEPLSDNNDSILMDVSKVINTPYARVEEEAVEVNNSELLKLALMEIKKLKEEIRVLKGNA